MELLSKLKEPSNIMFLLGMNAGYSWKPPAQ